jgi:hypothetical protein
MEGKYYKRGLMSTKNMGSVPLEPLGLYKIPTTAPWTQSVKATGRR